MKKLDIMNSIEPGKWVIVNGKVQRIEEFVPEPLVIEKEEKEKVEEIVKKGAKAEVDGKELRYDETEEEWKEEKKSKKKKGGKK